MPAQVRGAGHTIAGGNQPNMLAAMGTAEALGGYRMGAADGDAPRGSSRLPVASSSAWSLGAPVTRCSAPA